jgi:thioredoxin reductase (NADPH)
VTADAEVLAVLAGHEMTGMTGIQFLQQAHQRHPHAQRVLLIPWGNRSTSKPILKAVSLGRIDRYATLTDRLPDEDFHYLITELLRDWQSRQHAHPTVVTVVGEQRAARSHEFRDLLQRSGLPFTFHDTDSDQGRALLRQVQRPRRSVPGAHSFRR